MSVLGRTPCTEHNSALRQRPSWSGATQPEASSAEMNGGAEDAWWRLEPGAVAEVEKMNCDRAGKHGCERSGKHRWRWWRQGVGAIANRRQAY